MNANRKRKRSPSPPDRSSTSTPAPNVNPLASRNPTLPLQPNGLANPSRDIFDPWNSVATGHQRAEQSLSRTTSWRDNRNIKLGKQFLGGLGGGERLYDTVGPGSKNYRNDGRKRNGGWERGASGLRTDGQKSIWESMRPKAETPKTPVAEDGEDTLIDGLDDTLEDQTEDLDDDQELQTKKPKKRIFSNLCIYVNGSTAPLISDHKLKHLLAEHGARISIALGRRTVTHVIVGTTSDLGGAGGGLAAGKIQKEITRVRGKGIKYVNAAWVIESIKAGKRLPEAPYSNTRLVTPSGQRNVLGMFKASKSCQSHDGKEKA